MSIIKYYNLSQSLGNRACYLRSTDVEQMNYERLLWSIPDDWFYQWYLGNTIEFHETTTKNNGGKVIRIALPVIIDVLNHLWFKALPITPHYKQHFEKALCVLEHNKSLKTRLTYWKGLVKTINLKISFTVVEKEPNPLR